MGAAGPPWLGYRRSTLITVYLGYHRPTLITLLDDGVNTYFNKHSLNDLYIAQIPHAQSNYHQKENF